MERSVTLLTTIIIVASIIFLARPGASSKINVVSHSSISPTQAMPKKESFEPVTKLDIKDVRVGTGEAAIKGTLVTVNYTGWLSDGTVFDSSIPRGEPFQFPLGQSMVIKGWDEGVVGMKVGGIRVLTIPSSMAYGSQEDPYGKIPANSSLRFEVELLKVQQPPIKK